MDPYYTLRNTVRVITDFATFGVFGLLSVGAWALIIHHFLKDWEEQRRLLGWEEPGGLDREAERVAVVAENFRGAFFDCVHVVAGLIDTP